jgi:L-methionine (R)-S-oxide reductase
METFVTVRSTEKAEIYKEIIPQIESLLAGETDLIANLANVSSVIKMAFPRVSWVGFYLTKNEKLVLGPFQGKPACVTIEFGKGVCGTAASRKETVIVSNVHEFPGHITCDPDSKSEIVVPIVKDNKVLGVFDLDSDKFNTFDATDSRYLEEIVGKLVRYF